MKSPEQLFRKVSPPSNLADSFSPQLMQQAFHRLLSVYESSTTIPDTFQFADRVISRAEYKLALLAAQEKAYDLSLFSQFVRDNFDFYEVYGSSEGWGKVFTTGYYAPVMKGSFRKSKMFPQPIYKTPSDLVTVDLRAFALKHPDVSWPATKTSLRGQLLQTPEGAKVVPYLERKDIDVVGGSGALIKKNLEIVWLDPVDAFYLHIQGSGIVEIGKKRFLVGYDKQNGHPWYPIGRALTNSIPIEEMSMQRVRAHLATLTHEEQQKIFNRDPSYVFFKKSMGQPVGSSGSEVTAHRSIATDSGLFPKGTLGFLDIELPTFSNESELQASGWVSRPRWVFDTDTGGAIKGSGRVDLYMGEGAEAGQLGGVMKRHGSLWIVAPKQEFLELLKKSVTVQ